jgi:hypothetical protein
MKIKPINKKKLIYQRSIKSQNSGEKCVRGNVGGVSLTIHSINSNIAKPL